MKKNIKAIYLIELALLFLIVIFYMLTKVVSGNIKTYLAITFLLIIFISCIILFRFKIKKKYYTDYCNRTIISILMIAGIGIYLLGLILGFTHGYQITVNRFIYTVIPTVIIIILEEFIRSIIVEHSYSRKLPMIFITLLLALICIFVNINYRVINTNYDRFILISITVLPILTSGLLCTYLIYQSNVKTTIVYRMITELYMYILPIVPNLGYYIYASVNIIVPFIIYYQINKDILQVESKKQLGKITRIIYVFPIIIILVILIYLVSGIYKYKLMAVATNSMNDVFYRGDSIIIEYLTPDKIKEGDILVFNHKGKVITHRVVDIQKNDNKLLFSTKGDANPSIDKYITNEDEVIGKVNYVIKYIGFPTVWAKEILERGRNE